VDAIGAIGRQRASHVCCLNYCLLFELQHFYKTEVQCTKWYVHYVYKLYDLHVMAENHTEAGFTLKLHADLLSWNDELLPEHSDSRYPEQYEWQRKEAIYHKIIAEFNRGKVFIFCRDWFNF